MDLTEIRKRRKVTTDRRYNKKYAENNIRYAKQVVQWLVAVGKTQITSFVRQFPDDSS